MFIVFKYVSCGNDIILNCVFRLKSLYIVGMISVESDGNWVRGCGGPQVRCESVVNSDVSVLLRRYHP